jgi:formylmethanofuran dehydrogenase subunit C
MLYSETTGEIVVSGRFKLDKLEMRGGLISIDGETGNTKAFLMAK